MAVSGAARIGVAVASGVFFGLGLAVSGLMDPAKVLGFLDFAGDWDPTLAFVMGGALLICIPAYRIVLKRGRPLLARGFELPAESSLDGRLLGGAALFGVGWGLSGFCPGPAIAALVPAVAAGLVPVFVFFAAMICGMALHGWTRQKAKSGVTSRPSAKGVPG